MGREIRRVPANWQHPKDEHGHYIPMLARFRYDAEEVAEGLRDGELKGEPPHYGVPVMPQWPEIERTHWQMYEDTSEGTPISPVMATPEELAQWLANNGVSVFPGRTTTKEQWLSTIIRGQATNAFITKTPR